MRMLLFHDHPSVVVFVLHMTVLALRMEGASPCTNFMVTPGASADGSTMLSYNADDFPGFGNLYHYPATDNRRRKLKHAAADDDDEEDESSAALEREVYSWDSGEYLGTIPEADVTYNVMGNCNEYGVCIGETTFGGLTALANTQKQAKIDYGSLMYIALQRCRTARESIETMTSLTETYGYASSGETFSVVDKDEAWIMDMMGKGPDHLGTVWVARKVPDGFVCGHSNHARITTFPRNDTDNTLFAPDVVDFAREMGLFPLDGNDEEFSFSDTFDPKAPDSIRYSESRVWDMFTPLSKDENFGKTYLQYVLGRDPTNRMPLWIEPKKKVSLDHVRHVMSSHFEGTELDFRTDVGAGAFEAPYRPRPYATSQSWMYDGKLYVNERAIAAEKTANNFIAQVRGHMPRPLRGLLWFAADDASTTPRYPVYACSTKASPAYYGKGPQDGVQSGILRFDMDTAFWVQNMVSNLVYSRWKDSHPILKEKLDEIHNRFVSKVKHTDRRALELYQAHHKTGEERAVQLVTDFSVEAGDELHEEWKEYYGYLFSRFRDFIIMEEDESNMACGCKPTYVGFDDAWKARIVHETGTHYEVENIDQAQAEKMALERVGLGGAQQEQDGSAPPPVTLEQLARGGGIGTEFLDADLLHKENLQLRSMVKTLLASVGCLAIVVLVVANPSSRTFNWRRRANYRPVDDNGIEVYQISC